MELHCEYSYSQYTKLYSCVAKKIVRGTTVTAGTPIKSFSQTGHVAGKTRFDVDHVWIEGFPLERFPRNLTREFPNMRLLTVQRCQIKTISREDLAGLGNVYHLSICSNFLTSLPNDLFADMKALTRVFITDNKIAYATSKLVEPLEKKAECIYFTVNDRLNDWYSAGLNKSISEFKAAIDSKCLKPLEPEVKKKPEVEEKIVCNSVHHSDLLSQLFLLKFTEELCDCTIAIRDKQYKLHRTILAAQSSVFLEMFKRNDRNTPTQALTKCEDIDQETFRSFFDFFYTGRVHDSANFEELFRLSQIFKVFALEKLCEKKIPGFVPVTPPTETVD